MIPANELRIGNWVEVNGKPIRVKDIDDSGINLVFPSSFYENVSPSKTDCSYDGFFDDRAKLSIQPIPLTPEILEKCGFKKEGDFLTLLIGDYLTISTIYSGEGIKLFAFGEEQTGASIEYTFLHQLQNLYFALIGEELEIKFP